MILKMFFASFLIDLFIALVLYFLVHAFGGSRSYVYLLEWTVGLTFGLDILCVVLRYMLIK